MASDSSMDEIVHSSSARCRYLLNLGYAPARLTDYAAGSVITLLATLNSIYAAFINFHAFEESKGDEDRIYYTDSKTGQEKGVATVYFKYTEAAKTSVTPWTIFNIKFISTEHKLAKITYDYLHGKSKSYFGTLLMNPYLPRNDKLRETEHVIKQLREQMQWSKDADQHIVTGVYKMDAGWQWFIATEYFRKHIEAIEELFFQKKVTNLAGDVLRIYSESETAQMVTDIGKREKEDSKRKMVAYLNSSTEFSQDQLDELKAQALAATLAAQEHVYNYKGRTAFTKPKQSKHSKSVSANVTCKKTQGKSNEYWRITIWIMVASKEMAAVPSTVMSWSIPEHPTITLARFGNNKPSTFAKKQKAAWNTYSSGAKKQDFGGAAEDGSSSAASSSGSQLKPKKSKNKANKNAQPSIHKHPLSHLAQKAGDARAQTDDVISRLLTLEQGMLASATKRDLAKSEEGFARVASKEVTKRFKAFQQIMQEFALEMSTIKQDLSETVEEAAELVTYLTSIVSDAQRAKITERFSGMDLSKDQLQKVVDAAIESDAARDLHVANKVGKLSGKVSKSSKKLSKVTKQVEKTVERLAKEAGVEYQSPKVIKAKPMSPIAELQNKNKGKKRSKLSVEVLEMEANSDTSSLSDSDTDHLFSPSKKRKVSAVVAKTSSVSESKKSKKKKKQ